MAKKKVYKITAEQMFDFHKPKWNGFTCGHGAHGDKKYNRNKAKRNFKKYLEDN